AGGAGVTPRLFKGDRGRAVFQQGDVVFVRPVVNVVINARDLDVVAVVFVDGHRGGEIGLAGLLHLDLTAVPQDDSRGFGFAREPGHKLHRRAGKHRDVRRVLYRFWREAGEGREVLRLINAFDIRQIGDRELEDFGLAVVRFDPVIGVFLNVEDKELEFVVVFGRLHHLADPLVVAGSGLAGEDRRLVGAEVEQLGENLLIGALRNSRRAGFDFEPQGAGQGDRACGREDLRDAHLDFFRAEDQRGDEQRQARGGGPAELPETLARNDLVYADVARVAVGVVNQAIDDPGGEGGAPRFAGNIEPCDEARVDSRKFFFDQARKLGVVGSAAQRANEGEVNCGDHA